MISVCKKEFRSIFCNLRGFIVLSLFLLASGFLVIYYNLLSENQSIVYVLSDLLPITSLLCPVTVASLLSADRAHGKDRLLFSLPLTSTDIVLGKYLCALAVMAIPTAVLALVPLFLGYFGSSALGSSYLSLIAYFLFSAAISAVCLCFSAIFRKKLHSYIACYSFAVVTYILQIVSLFLKKNDILMGIPYKAVSFVGLFNRFELFVYGLFDVGAIVYYLCVSILCITLSVCAFERRRSSLEVM